MLRIMLRTVSLPLLPALLVPLAFASSGCELFAFLDQPLELPVDVQTPEQDFDVDEGVAAAEEGACDDEASCAVLRAICQTEAGRECDTAPTMPAEFPAEVEVVPGEGPVAANDLMEELGITEATELELAVPVDVAAALADEGVQTPDAVDNVSIGGLSMLWPENSLTFDAPPLDLYIANVAVAPGQLDAEALIASGDVEKIGTVGIDTDGDGDIDVGQVAGSTDEVPVVFIDGGNALLSEAFRKAEFTIVTAVPDGKGLRLKETGGVVKKPAGKGKIALKATVVFSVKASDVIK